MSMSSRKRQVSTSSSKPRSNQHSLSKLSSISNYRQAAPTADPKPDFRVYQSNSARDETHDDTNTAIHLQTEDSYLMRPQTSHLGQAQKSPTRNQRRVSDPNNTITDYVIKDASFPSDMHGLNDDDENMRMGLYNYSDNPEMNDLYKMMEKRFMRLERRLENNENLIHLHEESQRLNHMEKRNGMAQEELVRQETLSRITALENRMNFFEDQLRLQKGNVDQRLEDFTRKIEQYLDKFLNTTTHLGEKFELLVSKKDRESIQATEQVADLNEKLHKVTEDIKDRLSTLYETVENIGKLTNQTAGALDSEKYNMRKLEDDFLRLLSASKDMSQSSGDVKWLSEEIFNLKARQMGILNYLNFGPQVEHSEVYEPSSRRET